MFKSVHTAEHGRGANELNNTLEDEGENCHTPSRDGCFLKCKDAISKKLFTEDYFEFILSYKKKLVFWLVVEYQNFVEVIKKKLGFIILKLREHFLGLLGRNINVYTFVKTNTPFFGSKMEKSFWLMQ